MAGFPVSGARHAAHRGRWPEHPDDASSALAAIQAPTLVPFGAHDLVTSIRFADPLTSAIADSELVVFDRLSHAALHEDPETFNEATLAFLQRHRG